VKLKKLLLLAMLLVVPLIYNSCGQALFNIHDDGSQTDGTRLGNPMTPVSIQAFRVSPTFSSRICLDSIILTDSNGANTTYPIGGRAITLDPNGVSLPSQDFAPGTYVKIDLRLATSCPPSGSMDVTNNQGSFSSGNSFDLGFTGNIVITGFANTWNLNIQPIIDQLELAANNADVRIRATSVFGSY
jgi:hypothetical protein